MSGFWDKAGAVLDFDVVSGGAGLIGDFADGLVRGDDAVADQAQHEKDLAELGDETGMRDIYKGLTDIPDVGKYAKVAGDVLPSFDRGLTKGGAWIHNGIADLF